MGEIERFVFAKNFTGTVEYDDTYRSVIASLYKGNACVWVWVSYVSGDEDRRAAIVEGMRRLHDAYSIARV